MLRHKIISLLVVVMFAISLVSAVELKVVKVEDLKEGDVIIDKYGNEIVVTNITTKPSESLTISEYIKQKINTDSLKRDEPIETYVGASGKGVGSITGNAIVTGTNERKEVRGFSKIIDKIKSWWSRW